MSMQDPFFVVKEEVRQEVASMDALFARWKELLESTVTATNEEFDWTTQELQNSIKSIEYDLQDLEDTISIVESNRAKFSLSDDEIEMRKQFVREMRRVVQETKDTMQHPRTLGKLESDRRAVLMEGARAQPVDNETFLEQEGSRQQALLEKQDEDLDVLHDGVQRLGVIGTTINTELDEQNRMLDDLDEDVTHTEGNLKRASRRVKKLLKNTDKGSLCVIASLIIILIVLVSIFFS